MYSLYLWPIFSYFTHYYLSKLGFSFAFAILASIFIGYIPSYFETFKLAKRGGAPWPYLQKHWLWTWSMKYFDSKIEFEEKLNHEQLYIFCCFPHGPLSVNHMLTMTDCVGMLSEHYKGPRRDLAATVLYTIPFLKELLLYYGCVDASAKTAAYNLKKGHSLLIFIGGEKEQLLSENGKHKIFLKHRKGFVKLALQHGAHLIPMYAFGENDVWTTSQVLMDFRVWLQHTFQIGMPIIWGKWGTCIPHKVKLQIEAGKPLVVKKIPKEAITQEQVDEVHGQFMKEMTRLFDRTKGKHPEHANAKLTIY